MSETESSKQSKRQREHVVMLKMSCPECQVGKHANCDGTTWDHETDGPAFCVCWAAGHPGSPP